MYKLRIYYSNSIVPVILPDEFSTIEEADEFFAAMMKQSPSYCDDNDVFLDLSYDILCADGSKIARMGLQKSW